MKFNEHLTLLKNRNNLSEVGSHGISAHSRLLKSDWEARVLCFESDDFKRKIMESVFIEN